MPTSNSWWKCFDLQEKQVKPISKWTDKEWVWSVVESKTALFYSPSI